MKVRLREPKRTDKYTKWMKGQIDRQSIRCRFIAKMAITFNSDIFYKKISTIEVALRMEITGIYHNETALIYLEIFKLKFDRILETPFLLQI